MTMHAIPPGAKVFIVEHGPLYSNRLLAPDGTTAYIAAPDADAVRLVFSLWPDVRLSVQPAGTADYILPGACMALLAAAINQWGEPPCPP